MDEVGVRRYGDGPEIEALPGDRMSCDPGGCRGGTGGLPPNAFGGGLYEVGD